jgi:hypothetical protein
MLTFVCFQRVRLVNSGVGVAAGVAGAVSKFYPEPEPHKNDAVPQNWLQD